jgi:hypothetical protein
MLSREIQDKCGIQHRIAGMYCSLSHVLQLLHFNESYAVCWGRG